MSFVEMAATFQLGTLGLASGGSPNPYQMYVMTDRRANRYAEVRSTDSLEEDVLYLHLSSWVSVGAPGLVA